MPLLLPLSLASLASPRSPDAPLWGKLSTTVTSSTEPDDPASSPLLPLTLLECRVCMFHPITARQFMGLSSTRISVQGVKLNGARKLTNGLHL